MILSSTLALLAGGPGSGCNPSVGKCGRYVHGTDDDANVKKIWNGGLKASKEGYFGRGVYLSKQGDRKGTAYLNPHVFHVEANLKKPFVVDNEKSFPRQFAKVADRLGLKNLVEEVKSYWNERDPAGPEAKVITKVLAKAGYDGVVVKKSFEGHQTIVFDQRAVKVKGYEFNKKYDRNVAFGEDQTKRLG
jgi:hypothetical protein